MDNYNATVETALTFAQPRCYDAAAVWRWRRPSSQPCFTRDGLKVEVAPAFWLRRWTHWPWYFQNWNPSFRVKVTRVSGDEHAPIAVRLRVEPSGRDGYNDVVEFPPLRVGESATGKTYPIVTTVPGHTHLRMRLTAVNWCETYSYPVYPEERFWLAFITPFLGLLTAIAGAGIAVWAGWSA